MGNKGYWVKQEVEHSVQFPSALSWTQDRAPSQHFHIELKSEVTKSLGSYSPTACNVPTDWMPWCPQHYSPPILCYSHPHPSPILQHAQTMNSPCKESYSFPLGQRSYFEPHTFPSIFGLRATIPISFNPDQFREFPVELSGPVLPLGTRVWRAQSKNLSSSQLYFCCIFTGIGLSFLSLLSCK